MQAGSCRLRLVGGGRWHPGDSGGNPAAGDRPGAQLGNRSPPSSSWTAAFDSRRWTPGCWGWGGPWVEEAAEVGSGVKVGGLV